MTATVVVATDARADDLACLLAEPGGLQIAVPDDSVWVFASRGSTSSRR